MRYLLFIREKQIYNQFHKKINWIVVSFVIACPFAWCFMKNWLQSFVYRNELTWWVFAAAGITEFIVAILIVSWLSWRVATKNLLETLRCE